MTFRQFDLMVTRGLKAVVPVIAGGVAGYFAGKWLSDQFQVQEVTKPNVIFDVRHSRDGLTRWTDTLKGTYITDPSGTRGPYPSHQHSDSHDLLH